MPYTFLGFILKYMQFIHNKKVKKYFFGILLLIAFALPLIVSLKNILSGEISFWYDNSRDMLSAWENLSKPTLIGPTSGIPGIFYGPYWIWLLSVGLLFSKDPRLPAIVVGILPYFIVFPIILFMFSKVFSKKVIVIIWSLFIFMIGMKYAVSLWNPHLAPLLFLFLVYFLVFTNYSKKGWRTYIRIVFAGITAGLIINFHISFGLGALLGVILFFVIYFAKTLKNSKKGLLDVILNRLFIFGLFFLGLIIAYLPFLLFEYRHGFNQIHTAMDAFSKYGDVVSQKGLGKMDILQSFFGRPATLLGLNPFIAYIIEIIALAYFFVALKLKKLKLKGEEKKLLLVLFTASVGILFIFLTARNPVWPYHFIGTEIIFLLLIGLVSNKFYIFRLLFTVSVILIIVLYSISFVKHINDDPHELAYLTTKEYVTDIIDRDAVNTPYTFFNYSPSIYQYEYSYLFKWRHNIDVPYDPGANTYDGKLVYLIISPPVSKDIVKDFINYRTPNKNYKTSKKWMIPDGTTIIKRIRIK